MLQRADQYTIAKALVAGKWEDHKRPHIDVIIGGPMSGGDSVLGQKAYARAVMEKRPRQKDEPKITFKVGETKYPEHDDALVVSVHIANAQVKWL
ncbi:hypothetical protein BHE74_00050484 [Ensete ventricosum]|nr:hypothetical protein BHE74_00050484 [Ensete ventricosum]